MANTSSRSHRYHNKQPSLVVAHYNMDHLANKEVHELTDLLRVSTFTYSAPLSGTWLSSQALRAAGLHPSLRRPSALLVRAAVHLGRQGVPRFPSCANLCHNHQALDPRLIRDLLMMIMDECTVRSDRFRNFPNHTDHAVKAWTHRLDEVVGMWLGRDLFVKIFGKHRSPPSSNTPLYDRCEACLVAIVGGRHNVLADLRSSLVARYTFRQRKTRRPNPDTCPPPRLLRVVESWLSHLDVSANNEVVLSSNIIVHKLLESRRTIEEVERHTPTPSSAASGRSHSGQSRYVRLIHYGVLVPRVVDGKKTSRRMQHHRRSGNHLRKLVGKLGSIKARLSGLRTVRHHTHAVNSNAHARGDRTGDPAVGANGSSRHYSNDTPRSRDSISRSSSGHISSDSSVRGFDRASAVPEPLDLVQTRRVARERASLDNPSPAIVMSGALRDESDLNDASRLSRSNTVSAQRQVASLPSHPGRADSSSAQRPLRRRTDSVSAQRQVASLPSHPSRANSSAVQRPLRRRTDSVSAVCNFDGSTTNVDRADSTSAQRGLALLPSHHGRTASVSARTHDSRSQYVPARQAWPADHPKTITRKPVAPPASSVYSTDPSPSYVYSAGPAPSRVSTALASSNVFSAGPAPSSVYSTDPPRPGAYSSSSTRLPRRSMTPAGPAPSSVYSTDPTPSGVSSRLPRRSLPPATPPPQGPLPPTPPSSGRSHNPRRSSASASASAPRPRHSNTDRRPQTPRQSTSVRTVRRSACGPGSSPTSWI